MLKSPAGGLVPMDDEQAEGLKRFKAGSVVRGNFTLARNGAFHRKGFSLLKLCYDKFCEGLGNGVEYRGEMVKPCFDTFREQLVILSGHYDAVFDIRGNARLRAKSLSFASCSEEEFEVIYSSLINAALKHVYNESMSEPELRSLVDQILSYS